MELQLSRLLPQTETHESFATTFFCSFLESGTMGTCGMEQLSTAELCKAGLDVELAELPNG